LRANEGSGSDRGGKSSGTIASEKLKHLKAQPAELLQWSIDLLQGMPSWPLETDVDETKDFDAMAPPPIAGSMAIEKASTTARMARMITGSCSG
jgi:hypothetical protein